MSLTLSSVADLLVAILLVASIATSLRLSRRMARLRADETQMRQTIAELLVATDSAERAIAGLRATVAACDRTLGDRLRLAEATASRLGEDVAAGEAVIARVTRIADVTRRAGFGARPDTPDTPATPSGPAAANGLKAAVLAAREVAERASRRLEERAA